jgi:imidazolonepropionase-like amidohydrolase
MKFESILAGWLVDGRGEPARKNVLLTIHNGMIAQVAAAIPEKIRPPDVTDFSDCTLLPGLIDAHIHLFMSGTEDLDVREKQLSLPFDDLVVSMGRRIADLVACGIVACRDGGDRHAYTLRYKRDVLAGKAFPLQLKVAGAAWHQAGRYGKMIGHSPGASQTLGNCVSQQAPCIDHIKIVNSGLNSLVCFGKETSPQFDANELRDAITIGESFGCKTMVHANGKKPVEVALKAGCHSIEHGFFMGRENLGRMADDQIFWVPTAVTMKAYRDTLVERAKDPETHDRTRGPSLSRINQMMQVASRNLDHQLEQIHLAKKMGVPIALGTDAGSIGVHHGGSVKEEIGLLMMAGFSGPEAIQCATLNNARLLNLKNCGLLATGAEATFIAVDGPPQDLPDSLGRIASLYVKGKRVRQKEAIEHITTVGST